MATELILIEPGELKTKLQESHLEAILADALAGKNPATKAKYRQRLRDFLQWRQEIGEPLSKALLGAYVEYLAGERGHLPTNIGGEPTRDLLSKGYALVAETLQRYILDGPPDWHQVTLG